MKIAIAGTGYVGLVTGVCLANIGHNVVCVDNDIDKISLLQSGKSPIFEPQLEVLMENNKERLKYTTDYVKAYNEAQIIFIGVQTPNKTDGSVNLQYLYRVCDEIRKSSTSNKVIVIKSTVPIGTNDNVERYLNKNNKYKFSVVSNPEFLSQGTAVEATLYASRIVVGTDNEISKDIMNKLYEPLTREPYNVPYLIMDRKSAEMVKYASNNFLALKISYINEIANLCDNIGANIDNVVTGMGYDNRIGKKFLNAGIGYGGSCFPKDNKALYSIGQENGLELKTVKACMEVNQNQKFILYDKVKMLFENLDNVTVSVLGLTFKPNTDDLRESPAIDNIVLLLENGAVVKSYDPVCGDKCVEVIKSKLENKNLICNFQYYQDIDSALKKSNVALIMTEWPQIKNYDINNYKLLMETAIVLDGRNCYSPLILKELNIHYESIGRNN